jgi:hypothetical protein
MPSISLPLSSGTLANCETSRTKHDAGKEIHRADEVGHKGRCR